MPPPSSKGDHVITGQRDRQDGGASTGAEVSAIPTRAFGVLRATVVERVSAGSSLLSSTVCVPAFLSLDQITSVSFLRETTEREEWDRETSLHSPVPLLLCEGGIIGLRS